MSRPVRALYVHVPYCRRKCGYCDFYVRVLNRWPVSPLVDALISEMARRAGGATDHAGPTRVIAPPRSDRLSAETVFVGGGTPTILPDDELGRLLTAAGGYAAADGVEEYTVEANPATITAEKVRLMRSAGVNRVSIGAQSFVAAELAALERDHAPEQAAQTVAVCRSAGLERISLDLIFGIPGQTPASWRASLRAAFALEPEHLSCYGLTYEPGTLLTKRRRAGPGDAGE